jgi:hypothetical protein
MMRHIARKEGAPVDTRHDHDLTDWDAVSRFATRMANEIENAEHRRFHFARPELAAASGSRASAATMAR